MTRAASARLAGVAFLVYTAAGIAGEILFHQATNAGDDAAKLAQIARHATDVRLTILFVLVECFSAIVLAVTLYGITREQDLELATLGMACRVAEGVILAVTAIPGDVGALWLATRGAGPDAATANALRAFLFMPGPSVPIGAVFFAVGSTIFAWLLLRGRMVPAPLAGFGVFASAMLVVTLPLQLAGFSTGPVSGYLQWLPALIFQLVLAPWLLIKGVAPPSAAAVPGR